MAAGRPKTSTETPSRLWAVDEPICVVQQETGNQYIPGELLNGVGRGGAGRALRGLCVGARQAAPEGGRVARRGASSSAVRLQRRLRGGTPRRETLYAHVCTYDFYMYT